MLFVISFDVGICFLFFIINIWEIFFGFLDMVLSKVIFGFRMLFIIFRYEILLINGLVIVLNIKVQIGWFLLIFIFNLFLFFVFFVLQCFVLVEGKSLQMLFKSFLILRFFAVYLYSIGKIDFCFIFLLSFLQILFLEIFLFVKYFFIRFLLFLIEFFIR